jgi:hypothetical protein
MRRVPGCCFALPAWHRGGCEVDVGRGGRGVLCVGSQSRETNRTMITDPAALADVERSWSGVEALRDKLKRSGYASTGVVGGVFPFALADAAHNLPMFQAFCVLNDVLAQLAREGQFVCGSRYLGALVNESEHALPWQNFPAIRAGVTDRNRVAHDAVILARGECWKHIKAINWELTSWSVLS